MSFPRIDLPRRTDLDFRKWTDPDHHKEISPLQVLPIDMIKDFPVADSLHLLHLGIMKRCLSGWRDGTFKRYNLKWSAQEINRISNFLLQCRMPYEIHRAVRGLDCLAFWKGLEFRTFLLYIGPVLLKDFLTDNVYQHFLMLFCAVTICSCSEYVNYLELAETLLNAYIEKYIEIYGEDAITSNVHNLCHLVDDVRRFGNLESFSAYPFENMLHHIKCLLRTGNNPLSQVAKRITEFNQSNKYQIRKSTSFPTLRQEVKVKDTELTENNLQGNLFHKIILNEGLVLNGEVRNKWFLTRNNEIVGMKYATIINNAIYIYGSSLKRIAPFFETPIKSSHLNIFKASSEKNSLTLFSISEIKCKLVMIQLCHNERVFIPLLHSFEIS
ncbi:hypothetical protein PPYR_14085 [Photinus pyralis]|nr:hypothetical protein PPYR_14085 [Photinus pyralis]